MSDQRYFAVGLSVWQAMLATIIGKYVICAVAIFDGYVAGEWQIGFPVYARVIWGMYGSVPSPRPTNHSQSGLVLSSELDRRPMHHCSIEGHVFILSQHEEHLSRECQHDDDTICLVGGVQFDYHPNALASAR